MTFNFNARYGLFTYAQCGQLCPFRVSDMFSDMGAECIIGRENHDDGGLHLHAFVDFGSRRHIRDVRAFDVDGCHPNVVASRGTPGKGYDYATKDGDIVAGGLERPGGSRVPTSGVEWSTIVNATCVDEFWRLCEELAPRMLLVNFNSLRAFAEWRYRPEPSKYEHPRDISFEEGEVAVLDSWAQANIGLQGGKSCTSRLEGLKDGFPSLRGVPP